MSRGAGHSVSSKNMPRTNKYFAMFDAASLRNTVMLLKETDIYISHWSVKRRSRSSGCR